MPITKFLNFTLHLYFNIEELIFNISEVKCMISRPDDNTYFDNIFI